MSFLAYTPGGTVDDAGVRTERLRYNVRPRPKSKFHTLLDARTLFGQGATSEVTTRSGPAGLELDVRHKLPGHELEERLSCRVEAGVLVPDTLVHVRTGPDGPVRRIEAKLSPDELGFPDHCWPEVMLPFLMRGVPLDGKRRAALSWTNDRFVARVYFEVRRTERVDVPAGRFDAALIWMYPDLNDWIALGNVITRLAKPLLPRYDIWIERAAPHRVIRFEGPYGPPGAPEVVLELRD